MRRRHFDALRPHCPRCALEGRSAAPLEISTVLTGSDEFIQHGLLHCSAETCRLEYPIIDGIPIIVPDVPNYLATNLNQIQCRNDLPEALRGLLGDALGSDSDLDKTRQHLSIYCWGHYADLDPAEPGGNHTGSVIGCLAEGFSLPLRPAAPALDLGCSVGRTTFELAERVDGLALGIDLNFAMLRSAQSVLQTGQLSYERRRLGLVYDQREFPVRPAARDSVDFWACDTLALPFASGQFSTVLAMNLLDCIAAPRDLLAVIRGLLREGGNALLSTPYDWSPNATPVEAWIGGHSQRGTHRGAGEPLLRALLTAGAHAYSVDGFEILGEIDNAPWSVRLHDRSTVSYSTHFVAVRAI